LSALAQRGVIADADKEARFNTAQQFTEVRDELIRKYRQRMASVVGDPAEFERKTGVPRQTSREWLKSGKRRTSPRLEDALLRVGLFGDLPGVPQGRLSLDFLAALSDEPDREAHVEVGDLRRKLAQIVISNALGEKQRAQNRFLYAAVSKSLQIPVEHRDSLTPDGSKLPASVTAAIGERLVTELCKIVRDAVTADMTEQLQGRAERFRQRLVSRADGLESVDEMSRETLIAFVKDSQTLAEQATTAIDKAAHSPDLLPEATTLAEQAEGVMDSVRLRMKETRTDREGRLKSRRHEGNP
jgi:hypothetical protein